MMLRVTIAGMAGATVLMALMPGYVQIGVTATILFVLLRIVQGLCLGGEIPGAMVLITETMTKQRGFACGMLFLMINIGLLLAHAVQWLIVSMLPAADVTAYGWRIGFLVDGLIALSGFFLRSRLSESPAFAEMEGSAHKVPMAALLCDHRQVVILGFLADRIGLKAPAVAAAIVLAVAAIPIYGWIHAGAGNLMVAMAVISIFAAFAWGLGAAVLTAIFALLGAVATFYAPIRDHRPAASPVPAE